MNLAQRASISLIQHMRIDQRLHIPTHDFALESCFPLLAHSSWYGAPWEATTAGCGVCSHVKLNTIHVYCSGKSQSIYMAATALDQTCSVMHHVYDDMLCSMAFSVATAPPSLSEVEQTTVEFKLAQSACDTRLPAADHGTCFSSFTTIVDPNKHRLCVNNLPIQSTY